jgi:hypothetical protein
LTRRIVAETGILFAEVKSPSKQSPAVKLPDNVKTANLQRGRPFVAPASQFVMRIAAHGAIFRAT